MAKNPFEQYNNDVATKKQAESDISSIRSSLHEMIAAGEYYQVNAGAKNTTKVFINILRVDKSGGKISGCIIKNKYNEKGTILSSELNYTDDLPTYNFWIGGEVTPIDASAFKTASQEWSRQYGK